MNCPACLQKTDPPHVELKVGALGSCMPPHEDLLSLNWYEHSCSRASRLICAQQSTRQRTAAAAQRLPLLLRLHVHFYLCLCSSQSQLNQRHENQTRECEADTVQPHVIHMQCIHTSSSSSIHIPSPVTGSRASLPVPISPRPSPPPSPCTAPESPPSDEATFALAEDMSRQEHLLAETDLVEVVAAATLLSRARDRPPWAANEVRGDRRAASDLAAAVARGATVDKTVRNMVYLYLVWDNKARKAPHSLHSCLAQENSPRECKYTALHTSKSSADRFVFTGRACGCVCNGPHTRQNELHNTDRKTLHTNEPNHEPCALARCHQRCSPRCEFLCLFRRHMHVFLSAAAVPASDNSGR